MGSFTSFIAPIAEAVTALVPGLEEFAPIIAAVSGAAGLGEGIASGDPLGAAISGVGGALGAGDALGAFDPGGILGNSGSISGVAGGDIDPLSGVPIGTDNPAGLTNGISNPAGLTNGISNISGATSGINATTGLINGLSNISGTGGVNNISGTFGANNPAGVGPSLARQAISGTQSAAGAGQTVAGLINSPSNPTVSGTNLLQTPSSGPVNVTGGFADRQYYDQIDAIRQQFAASGKSGSPEEQQAIQNVYKSITGG